MDSPPELTAIPAIEVSKENGKSRVPFAEQFQSEEEVHDRWPGHPTRTCFEAKPTPELLALLNDARPKPSVADAAESDVAEEEEPEPCEDREAA